jgi:hypothetical protein
MDLKAQHHGFVIVSASLCLLCRVVCRTMVAQGLMKDRDSRQHAFTLFAISGEISLCAGNWQACGKHKSMHF